MEEKQSRELSIVDETPMESVQPAEPVIIPVFALKAALTVTGAKKIGPDGKKIDVRAELQGINIISTGEEIRVVAADGNRMFAYSIPTEGEKMPEWLEAGVTLSLQPMLKEQIAFLDNVSADVVVSYQTGLPWVHLSDMGSKAVFRCEPLTSKYPAFEESFAGVDVSARQTLDLESSAYQALYLKGVADLAKLLESKTVQVYTSFGPGKPTLITFPSCPGAILSIVPAHLDDDMIAPQTARLLAGPIAGTVAALRAHRTRWNEKLKKAPESRALQRKVAEYDERISAIIMRTSAPPQAITQRPQDEEVELEDDGEPPIEADKAEPKPLHEIRNEENRAKLTGAARAKALAKFFADVNAELSRDYDVTVMQLAEGVPLESWWTAGLNPAQAASRCQDWKVKKPANGEAAK